MRTILLIIALVVVVAASPRTLKIQETAHDIAKSVKSSNEYSLEEKQEILANLKAINNDAKLYTGASAHKRAELKRDLKEKLSELKSEMHQESGNQFEEEDVQKKIETIHNDIQAVKDEFKASHLSASQKAKAKSVFRKLESQYTELSSASSKTERRQIARRMKESTAQLKEIKSLSSLQSKKDRILELVDATEKEYKLKNFDSITASKISNAFEEMKNSLEVETSSHQLKSILHSKVATIRGLEADSLEENDFEQEKDFEQESSVAEDDE